MPSLTSNTNVHQTFSKPVARKEGPLISERTVRRFFGLVFGFAAIALWLVPSGTDTADVILLKTGFTAILCFCCIVALLPRIKD